MYNFFFIQSIEKKKEKYFIIGIYKTIIIYMYGNKNYLYSRGRTHRDNVNIRIIAIYVAT